MKKNTKLLLASLIVAAGVAGCGGGGGGDDTPPAATDAVPASASRSVAGLLSYLVALTALQPEDKEAIDVSAFAPPQPEDTEPQALD